MAKLWTVKGMEKIDWLWIAGLGGLFVFGLWHYGDVKAGAQACGDTWLMGNYAALLGTSLVLTGLLGWLFLGKPGGKLWKLEQIYPFAGLSMGVLYLLVFPPLSGPDEISHYISAYQLSSHMLGQPSNSRDGHVLVRGQDWFLEDIYGEYMYSEEDGFWTKTGTKEDSGQVLVLGQVLTEETYRLVYESFQDGQKPVRAGESEHLAVSPYPPVVTTPAAYIPQALGISLARILNLNSVWLAYLGRIGNLLFFVAMTGLAIKKAPFGKEILAGVGLLPMTLHLSATFSYDVWILAWMFYFTAYCLNLAFAQELVRGKDVAVLAVSMALAGPCKMVYTVLMGLCLLIPVKKFGSWKKWTLSAGIVFGAWVLAMIFINRQVVSAYVAPETENYIGWAEETGYSLGMLLRQPRRTIQLFYNTLARQSEGYHMSMIGNYLGNLDPVLDVPYPVALAFTGCLLCLAFRKPGESLVFTGGKRLWVWFLCLTCMGALMFSMLIAWTPVSSDVINGVQGRYFLPFLPVFLMTLKNDVLVMTRWGERGILYGMYGMNAYVAVRIFSIVSMRV